MVFQLVVVEVECLSLNDVVYVFQFYSDVLDLGELAKLGEWFLVRAYLPTVIYGFNE